VCGKVGGRSVRRAGGIGIEGWVWEMGGGGMRWWEGDRGWRRVGEGGGGRVGEWGGGRVGERGCYLGGG